MSSYVLTNAALVRNGHAMSLCHDWDFSDGTAAPVCAPTAVVPVQGDPRVSFKKGARERCQVCESMANTGSVGTGTELT